MSHEVVESESRSSKQTRGTSRRLDAAGWGLFFIWVGVSTLADLGWGVGLLGVAAIIYFMQAARRLFGRRFEPFWLVVGGGFLLGGIWDLYHIEVSLVPVVLILVGGAMLLSLLQKRWDTPRWCRTGLEGAEDRTTRTRSGFDSRSFGCCGWRR